MEGLADEHCIDARIRQRNRLRRTGNRLAVGDPRPHRIVGLDRNDTGETLRQLVREPARAGGEVDGAGVRPELERLLHAVERHLRVVGTDAVVELGYAAEAACERNVSRHAFQPTLSSRNARFSLSISRAITSRWISFVPS